MIRWWPAAVIALASVAEAQPAMVTVRGKVIDRATKEPVAGAVITIGSELAASGDDGVFVVAVPPGSYTVEVNAP